MIQPDIKNDETRTSFFRDLEARCREADERLFQQREDMRTLRNRLIVESRERRLALATFFVLIGLALAVGLLIHFWGQK